jgi:hypothetical protein
LSSISLRIKEKRLEKKRSRAEERGRTEEEVRRREAMEEGDDGGGRGFRPVFSRACHLVEPSARDRLLVASAGCEENLSKPT